MKILTATIGAVVGIVSILTFFMPNGIPLMLQSTCEYSLKEQERQWHEEKLDHQRVVDEYTQEILDLLEEVKSLKAELNKK